MAPADDERVAPPGDGPAPGDIPAPDGPAPDEADAPPDLAESLRQVADAGRASVGAASDAAKAFRTLLIADVSLARSAFGRTLALTGVAIAFGASAWLLLMATLVVFLVRVVGWSWSLSLLVTALLSLAITAFAAWQGQRYFEHTRLQATRRQLARLGIGELSEFTPEPGSAESARTGAGAGASAGAGANPPAGGNDRPLKDDQGIDVTPP